MFERWSIEDATLAGRITIKDNMFFPPHPPYQKESPLLLLMSRRKDIEMLCISFRYLSILYHTLSLIIYYIMPCNSLLVLSPFSEEGELIAKSVLIALLWLLDDA